MNESSVSGPLAVAYSKWHVSDLKMPHFAGFGFRGSVRVGVVTTQISCLDVGRSKWVPLGSGGGMGPPQPATNHQGNHLELNVFVVCTCSYKAGGS